MNYIDWVNKYKTTITEIDNTISILKGKLGRGGIIRNKQRIFITTYK